MDQISVSHVEKYPRIEATWRSMLKYILMGSAFPANIAGNPSGLDIVSEIIFVFVFENNFSIFFLGQEPVLEIINARKKNIDTTFF